MLCWGRGQGLQAQEAAPGTLIRCHPGAAPPGLGLQPGLEAMWGSGSAPSHSFRQKLESLGFVRATGLSCSLKSG